MLRQTSGSVVCPSCGNLVGINDQQCFTRGRRNPGPWGFSPLLSRLRRDLGFTQFVMGGCGVLYFLSVIIDPQRLQPGGLFNSLSPSVRSRFILGSSAATPCLP